MDYNIEIRDDGYSFAYIPAEDKENLLKESERDAIKVADNLYLYKGKLFVYDGSGDLDAKTVVKLYYFMLLNCTLYLQRLDQYGFQKAHQLIEGIATNVKSLSGSVSRDIGRFLSSEGNEKILENVRTCARFEIAEALTEHLKNGDFGAETFVDLLVENYQALFNISITLQFDSDNQFRPNS